MIFIAIEAYGKRNLIYFGGYHVSRLSGAHKSFDLTLYSTLQESHWNSGSASRVKDPVRSDDTLSTTLCWIGLKLLYSLFAGQIGMRNLVLLSFVCFVLQPFYTNHDTWMNFHLDNWTDCLSKHEILEWFDAIQCIVRLYFSTFTFFFTKIHRTAKIQVVILSFPDSRGNFFDKRLAHIKRKRTRKQYCPLMGSCQVQYSINNSRGLAKREQWKIRIRFHVGIHEEYLSTDWTFKGQFRLGDCECDCDRYVAYSILQMTVQRVFWR